MRDARRASSPRKMMAARMRSPSAGLMYGFGEDREDGARLSRSAYDKLTNSHNSPYLGKVARKESV